MNILEVLSALCNRINEENKQNDYKISIKKMIYKHNNPIKFTFVTKNIVEGKKVFSKPHVYIENNEIKLILEDETDGEVGTWGFSNLNHGIDFLIEDIITKYYDNI